MTPINKIKEEVHKILQEEVADRVWYENKGHEIQLSKGLVKSEKRLTSLLASHIEQTLKFREKEIIDEIKPRLYSLHANIDFVHNRRAREQAKELLDLLEELTQKPEGKC
jgi:hypothetical protein